MMISTNREVWKLTALAAALLTAVFAVFIYFRDIFIVIVVGIALIILAERLQNDYRRNLARFSFGMWMRRLYGLVLILFWATALIFVLITSVGELADVFRDGANTRATIVEYADVLEPYIPEPLIGRIVSEDMLEEVGTYVVSILAGAASQASFFILNGVLIIPLMFYLYFKKGSRIKQRVLAAVPEEKRNRVRNVLGETGRELHGFFSAKVLQSIVIGFIAALGFFIGGVPGWLLLAVIAGILNIIPFLGPVLGGVPPVLISLAAGDPTAALFAAVTIIIAQLVDNLYLSPFMVSGKVKIDPLLSILLVLIGAKLFGAFGMIFAIPIYLVYKIVLRSVYAELCAVYDPAALRERAPQEP